MDAPSHLEAGSVSPGMQPTCSALKTACQLSPALRRAPGGHHSLDSGLAIPGVPDPPEAEVQGGVARRGPKPLRPWLWGPRVEEGTGQP